MKITLLHISEDRAQQSAEFPELLGHLDEAPPFVYISVSQPMEKLDLATNLDLLFVEFLGRAPELREAQLNRTKQQCNYVKKKS
jgi:hypothetical protein